MKHDQMQGLLLRIELQGIAPPIWRQVCVPRDLSLGDLHTVIQIAMGWQNCHLHTFVHQGERIGMPDEESPDIRDEEEISADDIFSKKGTTLMYEYDFGDGWEHRISCEGPALPTDEPLSILGGQRACPPEDCGGVPGYYHLLECLSDPKHPEYEDMTEWLGGAFDPEALDLEEANAILFEVQDGFGPLESEAFDEF
jgi:hypothetical protein